MAESLFTKHLVMQARAQDQFGMWENKSSDEVLTKLFVRTKEDLRNIPVIADIDEMRQKEIRLIFQALAVAIEQQTGEMCQVVMEMSHEGFGRVVVVAGPIVVVEKTMRDAHRFGYPTLEKLEEEGQKLLDKAVETYKKFQPCKGA